MQSRFRSGFTIVELLIVIVIIGILAGLVVVAFNGVRMGAAEAVLQADLKNAATHIAVQQAESDEYTVDTNELPKSEGTTYQYTSIDDTHFCMTATSSVEGVAQFYITQDQVITKGACTGHEGGASVPSGYEVASVASGGNVAIGGYNPIQPAVCPTLGGEWVKVPGNSLYGETNGFCVQKYPANNVSGVATSQPNGPRWTALTQAAAKTAAEGVDVDTHLLSETEWMTIAANAAMQQSNWSGGSVGNGTLPIGSGTASYGGVSVALSNGETIHFDTGTSSYRASNEWTCYEGPAASSCGLAGQSQPIPANAYHTDQFGYFTSYGDLRVNENYYYGDPRFANPSLATYVTSARDKGLGYLRSSYASGSSSVYGFNRGAWTGANSSGLFTLYIYTLQSSYAHATYGFRAAK